MPNRIPTPGIKDPAVRKSPSATQSAQLKSYGLVPSKTKVDLPASEKKIAKAEAMFKSMKPSGNIGKDKEAVAKKTGVWPNGNTN